MKSLWQTKLIWFCDSSTLRSVIVAPIYILGVVSTKNSLEKPNLFIKKGNLHPKQNVCYKLFMIFTWQNPKKNNSQMLRLIVNQVC